MAKATAPQPQLQSADFEQPAPEQSAQQASEETRNQVAEAAYYRALHRGFAQGFELDDWLQAELEVRKAADARRGTN